MVEDSGVSVGEQVERDKRRQLKRTLRWSAASGAVTGGTLMLAVGGFAGFLDAKVAPAIAIALSILYVVTIGITSVFGARQTDEHEQALSLWAYAYGGAAYLMIYPPWYLLWRGGLVSEPSHGFLFLLFLAATGIDYAVKKYR